jgi:hypothetical protein
VPRLAIPHPAAPRSVGMLMLACLLWGCGQATAQTTSPFPDPLTPKLETDSRQPPRFQPFTRRQQAQADQPTTFAPPSSGAGLTGFDATNAPERQPPRAAASSAASTPASALAPTQTVPPPPSPYDAPIPPLPGDALASAPPGAPPVALGPIRRPKKRKAHADEPTDPYEPAGIHASAFLLYPSLELSGGYSSNPGATPDGPGAALYTVAPELQVQSEWSRHELKADLRGSYTGYNPDATPTLSRPYFDGKVDGRIDVTRDTRVILGSRALVSTDNPGSPDLQAGLSKLPVFVT